MRKFVIAASAVMLIVSAVAYAQTHQHDQPSQTQQQKPMPQQGGMHQGSMHHGAQHGAAAAKGDTGPSSQAFRAINDKMHGAMNIAFTGNTDVDFVEGMIPHHEGAVDIAKVVLAFGKDPEIRKLAEEIIKAQESEIALMKAWLTRNKR